MRLSRRDRWRTLPAQAMRSRSGRAILAVFGVAGSTLLVLVLLAAYRSLATGVETYTGQKENDLWVASRGMDNFIRSSGFLPEHLTDRVADTRGVRSAEPILRAFATAQARRGPKEKLTLLEVGYRVPNGLGGPPNIYEGHPPKGSGQIVIDRAAAFRLGAELGDRIKLNGRLKTIVGLSRKTNLLATQFVFSEIGAAQAAVGLPGRASFIIVSLKRGADPRQVAKRIERKIPGSDVYRRSAFTENNLREVSSGFVPIIVLLVVLGLIVSASLVSLLVQGLVEDRRTDIAVLLALGATPWSIAVGLVAQVVVLLVAGTAIGTGLSLGLGELLDVAMPTIELTFSLDNVVGVVGIFTLSGILAALVPVVRLRQIDPVEAFRP